MGLPSKRSKAKAVQSLFSGNLLPKRTHGVFTRKGIYLPEIENLGHSKVEKTTRLAPNCHGFATICI